MFRYKYTDKLLFFLAVTNALMFIPSIWGTWWELSFVLLAQGDKSQVLTTVLLSSIQWYLMLGFAVWAFFKQWHWFLFLYVAYLSRMVPMTIVMLIDYWKDNDNLAFINSSVYSYCYIFLWLLGLITMITMLIELDYDSLIKKWRWIFRRHKK